MSMIRSVAGAVARNWKITVPAAGVFLAGLAWLAFGYFGVHTAFIDNEVDEALPEFDVPAAPAAQVADPVVASSIEPTVDATSADGAESTPIEPAAPETAETSSDVETEVEIPADPAVAEIVVEASGSFAGTSRYDVAGQAVVLGNGTGQRFLRFEDFSSSNGPDLNVYLFNPDDPTDYIDLGDLRGNIGEQNYELSADIDLERYSEVSIWCVRFGVGFGSADLTAA